MLLVEVFFRDRSGAVLGCFASYFDISYYLNVELLDAMIAIKVAYKRRRHNIWLKCDLMIVVMAFTSP